MLKDFAGKDTINGLKAGLLGMNYLLTFCFAVAATIASGQNKTDSLKIQSDCSCDMHGFDEQQVYTIVEKMPEYPGGAARMMKLVKDALESCRMNAEEEPQTSLYLTFVVDTAGNVADVRVLRPRYSDHLTELEKSILEALCKMEKWTPGEQNGKKVSVRYNLPIRRCFAGFSR